MLFLSLIPFKSRFFRDGAHYELFKLLIDLKNSIDTHLLALIGNEELGIGGSSKKLYVEQDLVGKLDRQFKIDLGIYITKKIHDPSSFWADTKKQFAESNYRQFFWNMHTSAERIIELKEVLGDRVVFDPAFEFLLAKKNEKLTEREWDEFIRILKNNSSLKSVYEN